MAPFTKYAAFASLGTARTNTIVSHRLNNYQVFQRNSGCWDDSKCPFQRSSAILQSFRLFAEKENSNMNSPVESLSSLSSHQTALDVDMENIEEGEDINGENSTLIDVSFSAVFLLNLVAIIWGTQHSVIKMVVDQCDAASFSFARFAFATIIVSPFTPNIGSFLNQSTAERESDIDVNSDPDPHGIQKDQQNALAWRWGIEMGSWMFLGYAFQAIGLEYTTAQRSGFLLYLNVKLVPFFANILFGKKISISTWASAFTALAGTALIAYDGTSLALNVGDLWSVAAAAASAMFILRMESATNAVEDSAALNAASLWVVTSIAFVWCIGDNLRVQVQETASSFASMSTSSGLNADVNVALLSSSFQSTVTNVISTISSHPVELIYLGGITTALANYIQTKAQKGISAERASIIYALDPVYGKAFYNIVTFSINCKFLICLTLNQINADGKNMNLFRCNLCKYTAP